MQAVVGGVDEVGGLDMSNEAFPFRAVKTNVAIGYASGVTVARITYLGEIL